MKTLLILGAYYTEIEIVNRARTLGYRTIVTDQYTNILRSPAKAVADEAWNISWTDTESLAEKCREAGIDGVLAGFSEFRVEAMIRLCQRLGLPCSLTLEQLAITRDKKRFKRLCEQYKIPCVPEYSYHDEIHYPVIVKPVDRAGSVGITVARNRERFEQAYDYAKSLSGTGQVIVEDYIEDGVKVDVYYYVKNGQISLLGTSDTIMCHDSGVLQKAWPFPSRWENLFMDELDLAVRSMIKGIGIHDAYLTISAFYTKGHLYVFETGFRLSGEMSFNYYKAVSGHDYVKEMIQYSLGDTNDASLPEAKGNGNYSCILNFFLTDGIVGEISGLDSIMKIDGVVDMLVYTQVGDTIHNSTQVLKKGAMCTLFFDDKNELLRNVDYVNSLFSIKDVNGQEMIVERTSGKELSSFMDSSIE